MAASKEAPFWVETEQLGSFQAKGVLKNNVDP